MGDPAGAGGVELQEGDPKQGWGCRTGSKPGLPVGEWAGGWVDGWTEGQMDGWTDGRMAGAVPVSVSSGSGSHLQTAEQEAPHAPPALHPSLISGGPGGA